ncbi:MAG: contact-dependent growth inhibition system immunity protein [Rhodobacter sp.]|nr:contact-dependent growth inhibition system immunity protein [Rhodobacter sp.]
METWAERLETIWAFHGDTNNQVRLPTSFWRKPKTPTVCHLFNSAGNVSLRLQDGQVEIKPLHYRGRGHWEGVREREDTILPESVSDEAFGQAILDALVFCRLA